MQVILAHHGLRSMCIKETAISALVSELHKLLKAQAVLRHTKGVSPIAAAMDPVSVADRIFCATQEGAERLILRQRKTIGLVRVASNPGAAGAIFDPILSDFASGHPGVRVGLTTVARATLDAALTSGEFDLFLLSAKHCRPPGGGALTAMSKTNWLWSGRGATLWRGKPVSACQSFGVRPRFRTKLPPRHGGRLTIWWPAKAGPNVSKSMSFPASAC